MDTAVEDTEVEDRPGSNASNLLVVVFGTQLGSCPDAGWVVSSSLLAMFLLALFFGFVLRWIRGR